MLIFRLFEDTRHIGPMAERQTIAGAVKCIACHFHSMPLRAGENRGGSLSERLPKPGTLCKPIMHERPCFETPTEVHCREAQRCKVYSHSWCCWGAEGKRAVAAISAAHSSTPCCTLSRLKAGESNGGVWSQRNSTPASFGKAHWTLDGV
jgi:hypothetical protein